MLTWSSINLDSYVNQINREMRKLELLINRINDLCTYRYGAVMVMGSMGNLKSEVSGGLNHTNREYLLSYSCIVATSIASV